MLKNTLHKRLCLILIFSISVSACNSVSEQPKPIEQPQLEDKLKERAEKMTRELERQKRLKESTEDLSILEKFERTTLESDILKKLDKPDYIKEIKVDNIPQKIFFYTNKKYAVWLWKDEDKSQYTYRAVVSLNHGKFDLPLHNVMTEDELRLTARYFNESAAPKELLEGLEKN